MDHIALRLTIRPIFARHYRLSTAALTQAAPVLVARTDGEWKQHQIHLRSSVSLAAGKPQLEAAADKMIVSDDATVKADQPQASLFTSLKVVPASLKCKYDMVSEHDPRCLSHYSQNNGEAERDAEGDAEYINEAEKVLEARGKSKSPSEVFELAGVPDMRGSDTVLQQEEESLASWLHSYKKTRGVRSEDLVSQQQPSSSLFMQPALTPSPLPPNLSGSSSKVASAQTDAAASEGHPQDQSLGAQRGHTEPRKGKSSAERIKQLRAKQAKARFELRQIAARNPSAIKLDPALFAKRSQGRIQPTDDLRLAQ